MRRILTILFLAIAISLFCALMSASISYALPLNCPIGSRVIGIECFDADYNNTTPWYRRDEGAAIASFPFWLILSLAVVGALSRVNLTTASPATDYRPSITVHPKSSPPPVQVKSRDWLPTDCPHCGGTLSSQNVQWISTTEAKCPYCGGTIKSGPA
jgi:hypothetical protein